MDNKFYGIGVGVGDPDQITLKAIKTLKKLDVVILPEAKKDMGSTAYSIAKEYLKEDVELVFMEFPMLKNPLDRIEGRKANTRVVEKLLDEGKNVGFLTIGDTMTYSTYVYILEHLDKKYEVETIPGISSFADISSRFNLPIVMGDESLKIIGLSETTDIEKEIEGSDNLVFMKVSRNFDRLKAALEKTGNMENIILVSNCGKENQEVYFDISHLEKDDIHYFSTMLLKKGGIEQWKKFIS